MKREDLDKMDNPTWRSAYENALSQAQALGNSGYDAQAYAVVAADLALEQVEAELARAEAYMSSNQQPAPKPAETTEAGVNSDPAPDADAGWKRAVAGINSRNGRKPEIDDDDAQAAIEGEPQSDHADSEPVSATAAQAGWSKAAARVSEGR